MNEPTGPKYLGHQSIRRTNYINTTFIKQNNVICHVIPIGLAILFHVFMKLMRKNTQFVLIDNGTAIQYEQRERGWFDHPIG